MRKYKNHSLVSIDTKNKPSIEKIQTNLVSPTKRSLEQVTDALKRKRKRALKTGIRSKTRQKNKDKQPHNKQCKTYRKKNRRKVNKTKSKDIFS